MRVWGLDDVKAMPGDMVLEQDFIMRLRHVIAVDIAKIALAFDQGVTLREILRHAHEGVINRTVAMRMITAHDSADDLRGFLRR